MSVFTDKLVTYVHASFDKGEKWVFRARLRGGDSEAINDLAASLTPPRLINHWYATLAHQSKEWTLRVPKDLTNVPAALHEFAGQIPPITIDTVRAMPLDVIEDAFKTHFAPTRTEAQEGELPEPSEGSTTTASTPAPTP